MAIGAASFGAAPASSKRKSAKPATKSSPQPAVQKKSARSAKSQPNQARSKSSRKSTKKAVRQPAGPPRQQQPTSDRYREIQQALIDRGFLDGAANGQWDERSIAALKKFEKSQHLRENGKIDSMVLIALGLGPERTQAANQLLSTEAPKDTATHLELETQKSPN